MLNKKRRLTQVTLYGLALFCLILWLAGCATPRVVPHVQTVTVEKLVRVPVPQALSRPTEGPDLSHLVTNADLELAMAGALNALRLCNDDKQQISQLK